MANYDLTYEGSRVQGILDTGDELRDAGYIFRGEATPSTVPGTPTERVAYIGGPGTYTNFGSTLVVPMGGIGVFKYNGTGWNNYAIIPGIGDGGVFDLSAYNAQGSTLATYADLSAALTALNSVPADYKKGGMTMKFILTVSGIYVQYRLQSVDFNINPANWVNVNIDIANEKTAREEADNTLQGNIDSEAAARADADRELQSNIDTVQTNLDNEEDAREGADTTLQNNINSEAAARQNADASLQSQINNEIAARRSADASLQNDIDEFEDTIRTQIDEYRPIEITGNVTNAPDEEDLTSVDQGGTDVLKFKDRNNLYGMGMIIMRRDKTFSEQLTQTNTIYVIRYDFELDDDITIPANCVLEFDGGSLSNGTLELNDVFISSNKTCFYNIEIEGNFSNPIVESYWFDFDGTYEKDTAAFRNLIKQNNTIHFKRGDYYLSLNEDVMAEGCNIIGDNGNNECPLTTFNVQEANNTCKFLIGLYYKCGIQNINFIANTANRELDIIRIDRYFGMIKSDWRITLKCLRFDWYSYWNHTGETAPFYVTSIHFRHTDNNIYGRDWVPEEQLDRGFSYKQNISNIKSLHFHCGIKITTGYNTQISGKDLYQTSVIFKDLEIWAGKGISFEHDAGCEYDHYVARFTFVNYLFQKLKETTDTNVTYTGSDDVVRTGASTGFHGKFASIAVYNYDYWDTTMRGCVDGSITQSCIQGDIDSGMLALAGWRKLTSDAVVKVYDENYGEEAVQICKRNLTTDNNTPHYIRIVPYYYGFDVCPNAASKTSYGMYKRVQVRDGAYIENIYEGTNLIEESRFSTIEHQINYPLGLDLRVFGKKTGIVLNSLNISEVSNTYNDQIIYVKDLYSLGIIINGQLKDYRGGNVIKRWYGSVASFNADRPTLSSEDNTKIFYVDGIGPCIVANYNSPSQKSCPLLFERLANGVQPSHSGSNSGYPTHLSNWAFVDFGFFYWNETYKVPGFWNGSKFVDGNGFTSNARKSGSFSNRPTSNLTSNDVGFMYFCTSGASIDGGTTEKINIPIYYTGSGWVDANGVTVTAYSGT